jgi:endonuclease/exonuclease/phosphatase family metal-dependent hydrolase
MGAGDAACGSALLPLETEPGAHIPRPRRQSDRGGSSVNLRKILPAVETAAVWLFLLQALRALFSSLFGVIYEALFDQSLSFVVVGLDLLLLILATLTPLLLRRFGEGQTRLRLAAVLVVLITRIPLSLAQPTVQLYASILLLGGAALYVAHTLWHEPRRLMAGLLIGLGADQLLRALDYSYDPSLRPVGLPFVGTAAVILALLSLYLAREPTPSAEDRPHVSTGLALGAALFVEISLLALPNALSRWSDVSYGWTAPSLLLVTLLPLVPAARHLELHLRTALWPLGAQFSVGVTLLCAALAAQFGGLLAAVLLLITQLLVLFNLITGVNNRRVTRDQASYSPGLEVSLGLLLLLLLSFAFAFTFTYPYTLPFFRGLGTPVLLIGILIANLPAVRAPVEPEFGPVALSPSALSMAGAVIVAGACALLTRAPALPATPSGATLRVATYNIHCGFDTNWVFSLDEMAETIESNRVDILMLQEVDAGRVTSLCVDDALWLSQRLGMHALFQPTLEKLSGVALLSRYPLHAQGGQWLTSALEQTAIVYGAVATTPGPLHAYGLWLGLEPDERAIQLADALSYIGSQSPAALGGDFNATPDSPIYARLLVADLQDPFMLTDSDPAPTSPVVDPTERIDYIWIRGLTPHKAWVSDSTASDHRMVVVEVQLNP